MDNMQYVYNNHMLKVSWNTASGYVVETILEQQQKIEQEMKSNFENGEYTLSIPYII